MCLYKCVFNNKEIIRFFLFSFGIFVEDIQGKRKQTQNIIYFIKAYIGIELGDE